MTELDSVITGIPWQDAFKLRDGVDAVTGSVMNAAVQPFTPTNKEVKNSVQHYRFIQDESDLNQEIETSVSGKYNIQGVDISASASYLNNIKYSELSTTLMAQYEMQYQYYDEEENYELTSAAQKLISKPTEFRKVYGDYFIAGGRRSSRFIAVYSCQSSTVEEMDKFKASFAGEAPDVFSVEGSASFLQSTKTNNINTSVDIFMEGYEGNAPDGPWTPEKILEALSWFKEHETGIYLQAKLRHYSYIDPSYPRSIGIAPSVFVELSQLYTTVWDVRSRYASCPDAYQAQFKTEYTALDAGVVADQDTLATDATLRNRYWQQANALLSELDDVFARMDFYFKVLSAASSEPGNGHGATEGTGQQQIWPYGYSTYTKSNAISISSTDLHYADNWCVGYREHTFEYLSNGQTLIVGWEVISNWGDGTNGLWEQVLDRILLTDHAAVYVKSEYDRGCDWTLRIYYVNAKDYQFDTKQELGDIDKGYIPIDAPVESPIQLTNGLGTLVVSLYPFVPRLQQIKNNLTAQWNIRYPKVKLVFNDNYNNYKQPTIPDGVHVVCADNLFGKSLIASNQVKPLQVNKLSLAGYYNYALQACKVNDQLFSVPYLLCANTLLYRSSHKALASAVGPQGILDALRTCKNPTSVWPGMNEGLILDFSRDTTDMLYYLQALRAIKNSYPLYANVPLNVSDVNEQVLATLQIYTQIAGYSQVRYVDGKQDRLNNFLAGKGAAMVGVTELASFIDPAQAKNFSIRLLPYAGAGERAQLYLDSFFINAKVTPQEEELAIAFINMATSDAMVFKCLNQDNNKYSTPQYLIPAKETVMLALAKDYKLYEDIAKITGGNVTIFMLDGNAYSSLASQIPGYIRNEIGGPKTTEDMFDLTMVSDDPSAPTNLVNKW